MVNAGLFDGDILIVDRAEQASHGRIVVAVIDGEMTLKHLYSQGGRVELHAENPAYKLIVFNEGRELTIWGGADDRYRLSWRGEAQIVA